MTLLQPSSTEKTFHETHIAQVSLNLRYRLGLAKLKYQHGPLNGLYSSQPLDGHKPLDISEFLRSRCGTLLTSPPLRASTYQEPPQSARNKHAFSLNSPVMQPMSFASRKRLQSDPASVRPKKAPRVSRKSSYRLAKSSPGMQGHLTAFMAAVLIPETPSVFHQPSDEETDSELPLPSHQNASSKIGSSPPLISPRKHSRLARTGRYIEEANRSDLPPYIVDSPTPAQIVGSNQVFPPSIPPSQHAVLPSKTPTLGGGMFATLRTSSPQFNFADFVNLTPSPTQASWDTRTPDNPLRT
ncbi:hypothetical protein E8E15_001653 [Penicillium rubens]|nr:hypothetical protein E8E15_001653 [Penicillium rubens]